MGSPDPRPGPRPRSRLRWLIAGGLVVGVGLLLQFGPADLGGLRLAVLGLLLAGCVLLAVINA